MSELHNAAECGDHAKAVALLDAGADYDAVDNRSQTPALWTAGKGHLLVVRLLRDRGADFNLRAANGATPFLGEKPWHGACDASSRYTL